MLVGTVTEAKSFLPASIPFSFVRPFGTLLPIPDALYNVPRGSSSSCPTSSSGGVARTAAPSVSSSRRYMVYNHIAVSVDLRRGSFYIRNRRRRRRTPFILSLERRRLFVPPGDRGEALDHFKVGGRKRNSYQLLP